MALVASGMAGEIRVLFEYFRMRYAARLRQRNSQDQSGCKELEKEINALLDCYPRNHNYELHEGVMVPSWRLFQRHYKVASAYPDNVESLLDMSSCKGYYVLEAAVRYNDCMAVGIDVHEPFISASSKVRDHLGIDNACFYKATIDEMLEAPDKFKWPFQIILFLGSYHYFFWGSNYSPQAFFDHHEILARLSKLCSGTIVFSARLGIERLPRHLQKMASSHKSAAIYNTASFLDAAGEYFEISNIGRMGKDDLYLLVKR
jgi:hypothetical protein